MAEVKLNGVNNSEASKRHDLVRKETAAFTPPADTSSVQEKKTGTLLDFFSKFGLNWDPVGAMGAVLEEVVAPTIIDGLRDSIYTATDYILYSGRRSSGSKSGSKSGYREKSMRKSKKTNPYSASYTITWDEEQGGREEADRVLKEMRAVVSDRNCVTIMEMFAIAKRSCGGNFMFSDWGWYDLRTALVRHNVSDGLYYIDLPKPVEIDD